MNQIFKKYQSLLIACVVFIILSFMIYIAVTNFLKTQAELISTQTEVDGLDKKVRVLESNKALTQSQITNYNKLLTQLIPDQEDYFSILFALEQLSEKTGFKIIGYSIQLSESSPEKLQVQVQGDGDSEAFLKFLNDYKFAGGRFITNESISYTSGQVGQIHLALNFYSKKVNPGEGELAVLTPKQIDLMQEIQSKTTVVFKDAEPVVTSYPTKSNPF